MTLHKLIPEKTDDTAPMSVRVSLNHELSDISDAIVRTRAIQAFEHAAKCYPIHRIVRCAISGAGPEGAARACGKLTAAAARAYSVAQVYRARQ